MIHYKPYFWTHEKVRLLISENIGGGTDRDCVCVHVFGHVCMCVRMCRGGETW